MNTSEKSSSHTNADETIKQKSGDQLVEQVKINDTPFTAIKWDDKWFLTLGKYRLTNQLGSLEEAKAEAMDASWNRIMQIIQIMIEEENNELRKELILLKEQAEGLKKQIH